MVEIASFNARTDSWFDIAAGLNASAAVVVRECFDPDLLKRMRDKVGRRFDATEKAKANDQLSSYERSRLDKTVSMMAEEVILPEGSAPQLLRHPLFTGVANLALRAESVPRFAYFRRMSPKEPHLALPFHQDQTVIAAVWEDSEHRHDPLVNAWVPLDPSGDDRPGLELLTEPLHEILKTGEINDSILGGVGTEISEASVFARFPKEAFQTPVTQRGDVILFHGTTLHRTKLRPNMTGDRISVDVRFMAALEMD
jgi:hypothetical protein